MSNVLPFRKPAAPSQAAREQAALWIARLDAGATAADLQQIHAWLAQSPAHGQALLELAQLWDRMDMLGQLSTMFPLDASGKVARAQHGRRGALLATAAAVVAVIGLTLLLPQLRPDDAAPDPNFSASYQTAVGEQRSVQLADGSRIVLNTGTRIEVDYSEGTRRIELLAGEGLFEVAKDAARPFQVHAGERMVEAVGTAFSVQRGASDALEVLVTEGKVLLHTPPTAGATAAAASDSSLPLSAGQYAAVDAQHATAVAIDIPTDQLEARLSWQHGMLLFRDDPLSKVLEEVRRYTTLDIQADESLLDIRVGGYFRVDDIDGLLAAIDTNFRIDLQRDAQTIKLVPQ